MFHLKKFSKENFGFFKKLLAFFSIIIILTSFILASYPTNTYLAINSLSNSKSVLADSPVKLTPINSSNLSMNISSGINVSSDLNTSMNISPSKPINQTNITISNNITDIINYTVPVENKTYLNTTPIIIQENINENLTEGTFNGSLEEEEIVELKNVSLIENQSANIINVSEQNITNNQEHANPFELIDPMFITGNTIDINGDIFDDEAPLDEFPELDPVVKTTYIYAGNLVASKSTDKTEITYYVQDHLGSNRKVVNGEAVEQENEFYAFGETKSPDKSLDNDYKYNKKELDESELYYYGARYYNPELGRFTQADSLTGSLANPLSMNRYSYVENNPLTYIDPTGNEDINAADATNTATNPIYKSQSTQSAIDRLLYDESMAEECRTLAQNIIDPSILIQPTAEDQSKTVGDFLNGIGYKGTEIADPKVNAQYLPEENIIAIDTIKANPDNFVPSLAHEIGHAVQDAIGFGNSDYKDTYLQFNSNINNPSGTESDLITGLSIDYTEKGTAFEQGKIDVGKEIIPRIHGRIMGEDPRLTQRMINDFSYLSSRTKNDFMFRDSIRTEFGKLKP